MRTHIQQYEVCSSMRTHIQQYEVPADEPALRELLAQPTRCRLRVRVLRRLLPHALHHRAEALDIRLELLLVSCARYQL
jgi:hypothetical protein